MQHEFDVVTIVGPDDNDILTDQVKCTMKNVIGYRIIYIICYNLENVIQYNPELLSMPNIILYDERIFPFTLSSIAEIHGSNPRNGWYLQQLLKLYAGFIIPNILEKYLVIDSDTFFLKPTHFIENNKCLYNVGDPIIHRNENHAPYFEHMKRLYPTFQRVGPYSGISHHMMFETRVLDEVMKLVENHHASQSEEPNKPFWRLFLELVDGYLRDCNPYPKSGASEYEIYFNYILTNKTDSVKIRTLNRDDVGKVDFNNPNNLDYVSCHFRMR